MNRVKQEIVPVIPSHLIFSNEKIFKKKKNLQPKSAYKKLKPSPCQENISGYTFDK